MHILFEVQSRHVNKTRYYMIL